MVTVYIAYPGDAYPGDKDTRFDRTYYRKKHLPLVTANEYMQKLPESVQQRVGTFYALLTKRQHRSG